MADVLMWVEETVLFTSVIFILHPQVVSSKQQADFFRVKSRDKITTTLLALALAVSMMIDFNL